MWRGKECLPFKVLFVTLKSQSWDRENNLSNYTFTNKKFGVWTTLHKENLCVKGFGWMMKHLKFYCWGFAMSPGPQSKLELWIVPKCTLDSFSKLYMKISICYVYSALNWYWIPECLDLKIKKKLLLISKIALLLIKMCTCITENLVDACKPKEEIMHNSSI